MAFEMNIDAWKKDGTYEDIAYWRDNYELAEAFRENAIIHRPRLTRKEVEMMLEFLSKRSFIEIKRHREYTGCTWARATKHHISILCRLTKVLTNWNEYDEVVYTDNHMGWDEYWDEYGEDD